MAGVAYYNTGTATVAANSKTVTGTGTNWLSTVGGLTAIKAGDKFGIHVGRPIIIASVDSNTQLTLEDNWPGPAQTNAAYRIELTSPDVIAVEALRRMLGSLSSGVLYGLSQLPSTPSKALTIDENGSAALADLSTLGKSLIASLNSSAAYGVLGTIPNAQLPTRIRALSTAVTDADTVLENGSYAVTATTANLPEAQPGMLVVDMYSGTTACVQYYSRAASATPNLWYRIRNGSIWGSWGRIPNFGTDNIIPEASLPPRIRAYPPIGSSVTDANAATEFGLFRIASTGANIPVAGTGLLFSIPFDAANGQQLYMRSAVNELWLRRRSSGAWAAWTRIDGDLSGPGAAVANNALVGFNGTSGYLTKALTTIEALGNLGPVLGGVAPEPVNAGVGMVNGDFDTVIFPGVYTIAGNWANGPLAPATTHTGVLTVQARSYNNLYIQRLRLQDGRVFKRIATAASGAWQAWGITEGDVSGPATSVDNGPVAFSGTTGKIIKPITGAIAALHALTPAANQLPYFTSGTAAALTTLSAFARTVIDDANGAAMFATMGATITGNANAWTATFPNGFKVQGGNSSHSIATTDSGISFTWPSAFSTICFSGMATAASHASNVVCGAEVVNLTGSQGWARHLVATNTVIIRWVGFGY